ETVLGSGHRPRGQALQRRSEEVQPGRRADSHGPAEERSPADAPRGGPVEEDGDGVPQASPADQPRGLVVACIAGGDPDGDGILPSATPQELLQVQAARLVHKGCSTLLLYPMPCIHEANKHWAAINAEQKSQGLSVLHGRSAKKQGSTVRLTKSDGVFQHVTYSGGRGRE
ncbi:unnamed protein product, partial [Ectocarpus sp. 8 AP-2014]